MPVVVDASVAASWVLPDEKSPELLIALDRVRMETAVVPELWWYEIRNVLLVSERRKSLTAADTSEFLEALRDLPIVLDRAVEERELFRLARQHRLTIYDAAYLELARRTGSDLATLDKDLVRAAGSEGVPLIATAG